jgi:hypothetical protein
MCSWSHECGYITICGLFVVLSSTRTHDKRKKFTASYPPDSSCHARHANRPGVLGDLEDSIDDALLLVSPGGDAAEENVNWSVCCLWNHVRGGFRFVLHARTVVVGGSYSCQGEMVLPSFWKNTRYSCMRIKTLFHR